MNSAIEFQNVTVRMNRGTVLENITVTVLDKTFVIVFGPNGAGKTTLLKTVTGELQPSDGKILVYGEPIQSGRRVVGYVPQDVTVGKDFPVTVFDTVLMGRYGMLGFFRRPKSSDRAKALEAIHSVGLEGLENINISDLSGGQRQRVFLARALAAEPKILLLDEATSGVDIGAKESIYELMVKLKSSMTVLFVTHDVSVISKDVDQILCLNRQLVSHGRPEEALTDEALRCMYGEGMALFSHCATPHVHVHKH